MVYAIGERCVAMSKEAAKAGNIDVDLMMEVGSLYVHQDCFGKFQHEDSQ